MDGSTNSAANFESAGYYGLLSVRSPGRLQKSSQCFVAGYLRVFVSPRTSTMHCKMSSERMVIVSQKTRAVCFIMRWTSFENEFKVLDNIPTSRYGTGKILK